MRRHHLSSGADSPATPSAWRGGLALWLLSVAGGCSGEPAPSPERLQPLAVMLAQVDWLSAPTPLGQVAAVTDTTDDVVVYSDGGATYYAGGGLLASDSSVRSWRAAEVVPALGYRGSWMLSVDGSGRLYRLRDRSQLEEVTARYGLSGQPVRELAALNDTTVAFRLEQQLAVVDGMTLNRYDLVLRGLAAGGGRLAAIDDSGVPLVEPASGQRHHLALPGAIAAAFDGSGRLWAATAAALYREAADGQSLTELFSAPPEQPISGLVASRGVLWLGLGDTLALVRDSQLLMGQPGLLPAGATLRGSASGDVWLLSGGQLGRVGEESGGGADQHYYRQRLVPIYNRLCQSCHQPGGSARLDLSTYSAWAARRSLIEQRVVAKVPSPMPPVGTGTLTSDELNAVRSWSARLLGQGLTTR